jgi:hypothetical protein
LKSTILFFAAIASLGLAKPEKINLNDMREPVGVMRAGVLILQLDTREGRWLPNGSDEHAVFAFSEMGRRMQNPGPLIRLVEGQHARVFIQNWLDVPLTVYGFSTDTFHVDAKEYKEVPFTRKQLGTYSYAGHTTVRGPVNARTGGDSQLNGIIIVDRGEKHLNERIFMVSSHNNIVAVNGREKPETLELRKGVKYRFRAVDARSENAAVMKIVKDAQVLDWSEARDGYVEFVPSEAGAMALQIGDASPVSVPIRVK